MSVKIAYMHQHKKRSVFCQDKMDRSIYEEQLLQCEVKKKNRIKKCNLCCCHGELLDLHSLSQYM